MFFISPSSHSSTTAQQEDGWPLGLQRLNRRVDLARSLDLSSSVSFSTLLTSTSSRTFCSSSSFDLDIKGIEEATLENLIGATSRIHLPRRLFSSSITAPQQQQQQQQQSSRRIKKSQVKLKTWFYSLCSRPVSDGEDHNCSVMAPQLSLGYLLEQERKDMSINRR